MKRLTSLILLFAFVAFAADPYPYPQPKPTTQNTPETVIRLQYPIGPQAYDNFSPAVWDTDIGGGMQVRTNAQDRANVRWMRLGAIVMDQTDRTYYGVDVKEDGTLAAYRPLFKLDGGGIDDKSIYSTDGDIDEPRRVNLNNNSLTFSGVGQYTINTTGTLIDTGPLQLYGDNTELVGRQSFKLATPAIMHGQATNGWVLTLIDSGIGLSEWRATQTEMQTPVPDTSIYINDGGIAQNRTMMLNQHTLKFDGGSQNGTGIFSVENTGTARVLANNIQFTDYSTISFSTPKTRAGQVNFGDALLVTSAIGSDPVTVEFGKARDTSIYTDNGQLTGNRDLNANAFGLTMRNIGVFTLESSSVSLNGFNGFFILTPDVGNHFARDNQILTLINKDSGQVEFRDLPSAKNLYNTSDVLTGDRKVTGASRKLEFSGVTDFTLSGQNTILEGVANVSVKAPGLATANPGYVLTLVNKITGAVDYRPAESFYYTNGTLTSDRTVEGASRMLRIQNVGTLDLKGQNTSVGGTTAFNLLTPNVNSRTASSGQVLTLADTNTGRVEFSSIVFPALLDTSIYNTNGFLSGDRLVSLNGRNLDFVGTGVERFQIHNPRQFAVYSATNGMWATNEFFWGSPQRLKIDAPGMRTGGSLHGKVLMVTDGPSAVVDMVSPTNIYSGNGTLLGDRIIQAASKDLSITNADEIFLQAGKLKILTPAVKTGVASGGYSLQLKDTATGEVEFGPTVSPDGNDNIYNINGSLQGDRVVTMGGRHLDWTGNGSNNRFQLFNIGALLVYAKTNDFFAPYLFRINAPTNFVLITPKVATSGAAALAGQVLTLNANGTSDFQSIAPTGEDTSIYKGSGTLLGNTTVNGAGNVLTFSGSSSISVGSVGSTTVTGPSTTVVGTSQLRLQPPGFDTAAVGTVLTKVTADGQTTWQPLPLPPVTIYTGNGDLTSSRTVRQNNLGLSFDGGGAGFFGVANQGSADIRANAMLIGGAVSTKIATPKIAQGQGASLLNGVLTLKAADGTVEFGPFPGAVNVYNTSSALTDNRDVGLAGKYLKFNGPGAVEFNSSGSPFSVSGASTVLMQGSSSVTLSSSGSIKIQTQKAGAVVKPNVGDVLTYQAADATVEYVPPQNIYNNDGLLATGANNQRRVDGNQKAFLFDNLVSHTVDSAFVYLTGRNSIRLKPGSGTIAQGYVLTSTDVNGTATWQPIAAGGPTLYTANDSLKSPRTVTMGANSLTFQGSGVTGGAFSVNAASSLNLQSAGIASLEAASGSFLKIRTPKVTKGDGMVIPGMVLMMQGQDGTVEYQTLPENQNIYTINGSMVGGKRTVTGNGQGITWSGMGPYEMFASTHVVSAPSGMFLQTPSFRSANSDGKKWVLTMQDPNSGRVEFESPPASGLPAPPQNTIYTANDNLQGDRTVGGSGGVYGLTLGGLKHFNVTANSKTENITGNASVSATGLMQINSVGSMTVQGGTGGTGNTLFLGGGSTIVGTTSRTGKFGIVTPSVQTAADSLIRSNYVMTLSADGSAEWKAPQTGSGGVGTGNVIQHTGILHESTTGFNQSMTSMSFAPYDANYNGILAGNFNPIYSGSSDPAIGTRVVARLYHSGPNSPGGSFGNAANCAASFCISSQSGAGHFDPIVVPNADSTLDGPSGLPAGILGPNVCVDLVFMRRNATGPAPNGTASCNGCWVLLNSSALTMTFEDRNVANVQLVGGAGIVDLAKELAGAPLSFKKISTLGLLNTGDGNHGDYYLTAYDPTVSPAFAVRSSVNTNKMWKVLIAR